MSEPKQSDAVKSEIDLIGKMLETGEYIAVSPICLATFDNSGDNTTDCRYCPIWAGPLKSEACKKFVPPNQTMTYAQFYDYVQEHSETIDEKAESWLRDYQRFLQQQHEQLVVEGR